MKRIGVVILNWNGKSLLEKFLPSVIKHTDLMRVDLVVADNGSTDDSLAFLKNNYPFIRQIAFDANYGFAEGYNKALALLSYEYVVLLNSDVEVSEGWLNFPIEYLDAQENVVAVQPKLLSYNNKSHFEYAGAAGGYMDIYGYPFCRGRVFAKIEKDNKQYDCPIDILWGSGACLILRLEEYKKAGGFDNYFFAHQEEIDLCWRWRARGKRIVCLPQSIVYHVGGATLKMEHPQKTFLNFRNNLLMLYKNLPEKYYRKVMRYRFFFDNLAVLHFLFKGYPLNALAIIKARKAFKKQKKNYLQIRNENLTQTNENLPPEILEKSLLWNYHICFKNTYSSLLKDTK